jgi:SAM-dependent methyltransferase
MALPTLDWEARFAIADGYLFGEEPTYFLRDVTRLLPTDGTALAVADGEGRNGVWLARHGLDVTSVDVSPTAQARAKALADKHNVPITLELGDAHDWDYPEAAFDVVAEVFTQFSKPDERTRKWAGMRKALKSGGYLVIVGYRPEQLAFNTGGPRDVAHLYSEALLREAFADYTLLRLSVDELQLQEGRGHDGMSATIGAVWRKP